MKLSNLDILYSTASRVYDLISKYYKYPIMIQIEPTTRCNLKCVMCEHNYLSSKTTSMKLDEFKTIFDGIPSFFGKKLVVLNFTGIGESLLNPKFNEMLAYSKKGIFRTFTDNFTIMNKARAKKLIELNLDALFISMDGATKKIFEDIRVGAKFENVIKNIINFVELKKKLNVKKPNLIMRFVPTKDNVHELPRLIKLANKIGIKSVTVPSFYSSNKTKHLRVESGTLNKYKKEAKRVANNLNVKLTFRNQKPQKINNCLRAKNSMYITAKGKVLPCCFINQFGDYELVTQKSNFGDITKAPIKEIWTNKKYKEFRKLVRNGTKPAICKDCKMYY